MCVRARARARARERKEERESKSVRLLVCVCMCICVCVCAYIGVFVCVCVVSLSPFRHLPYRVCMPLFGLKERKSCFADVIPFDLPAGWDKAADGSALSLFVQVFTSHAHTHIRTHTRTYAHTHTHTHMHAHTHTRFLVDHHVEQNHRCSAHTLLSLQHSRHLVCGQQIYDIPFQNGIEGDDDTALFPTLWRTSTQLNVLKQDTLDNWQTVSTPFPPRKGSKGWEVMCMYVCVCCLNVCTGASTYVFTCVHLCICMNVCVCIILHEFMFVFRTLLNIDNT